MRHPLAVVVVLLASAAGALGAPPQQALQAFEARLPALRAQTDTLTTSAEAAAQRIVAKPDTNLIYPIGKRHHPFSYEFMNRAGGLAKAYFRAAPRHTAFDGDVVLLSVRSWDEDEAELRAEATKYRERNCLVILFGSHEGQPAEPFWDFPIDNGASHGDAQHGPANIAANLTLGWMWTCEYAAALTRLGKIPGVLRSKGLSDGSPHNQPLQTDDGRDWLGEATTAVPAGELAHRYLDRIEKLIDDLRSPHVQEQLSAAADLIAQRMRAGVSVYLCGTGHSVHYEMLRNDLRANWTTVHSSHLFRVKDTFARGEMLVWIGYMGYVGLRAPDKDTLGHLLDTGVDLVLCEAPPPTADNTAPDILPLVSYDIFNRDPSPTPVIARIDQSWSMPDAEVPVPFQPDWIAPISGVNAQLLLRMLDEEVTRRLPAELLKGSQTRSPAPNTRSRRRDH